MSVAYGTDFSEPARAGAAAAAALARRRGEDLLLVHAVEPEARFWSGEGGEDRARELLDAAAADLRRRHPDLQVHPILLHGPAQQALARLGVEQGVSCLVVASQGHSSSPVFRVGGTSERLALVADVPVLVVRESEPFERWAAGERPLRVVLGLDESEEAEAAIRFVRSLRESGPCDVIAARVYSVPEDRRRYGLEGAASWVDPDPELERLLERDLRARLPELPGSGELAYRLTLGIGRQGDDLLRLAESEKADLVVVGSRQRRGLPRLASVTSVLLHFGGMAVASVPDSELLPRTEARRSRARPGAPSAAELIRRNRNAR